MQCIVSECLDDGTYAMKKVLIQNNEELELVKEEIRVSSLFSHPNLLPLLDHAIISVKVITRTRTLALISTWKRKLKWSLISSFSNSPAPRLGYLLSRGLLKINSHVLNWERISCKEGEHITIIDPFPFQESYMCFKSSRNSFPS